MEKTKNILYHLDKKITGITDEMDVLPANFPYFDCLWI